MKISTILLLPIAALFAVFFAGCEGIEGVPYQPGTPAARIHEGHSISAARGASAEAAYAESKSLEVPVVANDSETARYLEFSPVQVNITESNGKRLVTVYTEVTPQPLIWRVTLIKDGREYHHFNAATKHHQFGEVISLETLALDPSLPVPDKILVTRVTGPQE
jgi:hypothetical protein